MKAQKFFLIPNAGGSAVLFNVFKKYIRKDFEFIPLELPGRGMRIKEPFIENFNQAVSDLFDNVKNHFNDDADYSIFGYSMGCNLAYELSKKIISEKNQEPVHMFFAARYPPDINRDVDNLNLDTFEGFEEEINKWGGLHPDILGNKEAKDFYLKIIWNDFKLLKSYKFDNKIDKYNCGISVFTGKYDKYIFYNDLVEWEKYTNKKIDIYQYDDGHFFINNHAEEICRVINKSYFE
jgi:medium-chain acyl-[acyl-carrier-protein] hydrolase